MTRLATLCGAKQDAVKMAVTAALDRMSDRVPLREQFAALRAKYPLPEPAGLQADKTFFDDLSGEP